MKNLNEYKVTEDNVNQLVNVEQGYILNPFIGYKGWNTIKSLCNVTLPDINYNAKFYRKKNIQKSKVLHVTDELMIVDVKAYEEEVNACNGKIEQYIGDGEIITELFYSVKEDDKTYLKRAIKEITASYEFYSKRGYEKRFYIEGMEDIEKLEFTRIILANAQALLTYLNELSK